MSMMRIAAIIYAIVIFAASLVTSVPMSPIAMPISAFLAQVHR